MQASSVAPGMSQAQESAAAMQEIRLLRQLGGLRRAASFRRYVSRLKAAPPADESVVQDNRMADAAD